MSETPQKGSPRARGVDRWRLVAPSDDAEFFCPPSPEAERLTRSAPWLFAPEDGRGSVLSRVVRSFFVAPFTQFTFMSFDLQIFLLDVLHTSWVARMGHLVGMTGVNFFFMLLLSSLWGPEAGMAYGIVLLGWYAAVARSAGLRGWWWLMLGVVSALVVGSGAWARAGGSPRLAGLGILVSGLVVTFPHAAEPKMPPRAGHPHEWRSVREVIFGLPGENYGVLQCLWNAFRVASYPWIGLVNELWASPRLMPYNFLRVMMGFGYAPELRTCLDSRRDRAWASGNPALDYVGIGGGTFMKPADMSPRADETGA